MEAVIMAAGLGTRLRPHTEKTPKPLLPVQGRPILDWILGALPTSVDRIVVVVNYLSEQIEAYLQTQRWFADWQTVRQDVPRGTGDALRSCQAHLRSDWFLVLNGDDLYGAADLERLASYSAAMIVHPVDQPEQFGIAFTRPDGTLEKLVEKPKLTGRRLANIGAYAFPKDVFDFPLTLSPRGEYEITEYVGRLAEQGDFQTVTASFWYPIGTIEAWRNAENADLSRAAITIIGMTDPASTADALSQAFHDVLDQQLWRVDSPDGDIPSIEAVDEIPESAVSPAGLEATEHVDVPPSHLRIVEALLFVGSAPLTAEQAGQVIRGLSPGQFHEAVDTLNRGYREQGRPYAIHQLEAGFRLSLRPHFRQLYEKLYGGVREARLSTAAVEALAVVAYRQPVTKTEVDSLRGHESGALLRQLVRRGLVAVAGRAESGGRDVVYGTTPRFLELFGLSGLDDLPETEDLQRI